MKKKSTIMIGLVCVGLLIVGVCLFVPIKANENITVPAMIICDGKLETENTNLSIAGTWTRSIATPSRQSFAGTIHVDALDYTHRENGWDLNFQVTDDMSGSYLSGGLFYNSNTSSDFTGYGWLYTDKDHDYYVLVTNQFDSQSEDYIVIAPAENEEEARTICSIMGLSYLQD